MCIVIDTTVNCLKGAGAIGEVWGDSGSWQLFFYLFFWRAVKEAWEWGMLND